MQQPKGTAKFQRAHHLNKLKYIGMKQFHYFLSGIGSVAVLMPGSTPLIRRSRVGSLNETGNRVAKTWSRAFVKAQE